MKVYTLNHGRPIGMEPTIYINKPDLCECGGGNCNPWCPELVEWKDELEARRYLKKYYPKLYETELKVVE